MVDQEDRRAIRDVAVFVVTASGALIGLSAAAGAAVWVFVEIAH